MKGQKIISMLLIVVLFFSNSHIVNAAESGASLRANMDVLNEELEAKGTSVLNELYEAIEMLQVEKEKTLDAEEINKIQALIDETQELIIAYEHSQNGIATWGRYQAGYSEAVATVASYFYSSGYLLAYELLVHAKDNERLDSTYVPVYGDRIEASSVVGNICRKHKDATGSACFESMETKVEKDLYYAIHNFNYSYEAKTNKFTLTDRYDYAFTSEYTGVADVAIDTMYTAQRLGVLVPYYAVITVY